MLEQLKWSPRKQLGKIYLKLLYMEDYIFLGWGGSSMVNTYLSVWAAENLSWYIQAYCIKYSPYSSNSKASYILRL